MIRTGSCSCWISTPWFEDLYRDLYTACRNTERVMGMFSEELKILDRNTVQYMIDEMEEQIKEQGRQLKEKDIQLKNQKSILENLCRSLVSECQSRGTAVKRQYSCSAKRPAWMKRLLPGQQTNTGKLKLLTGIVRLKATAGHWRGSFEPRFLMHPLTVPPIYSSTFIYAPCNNSSSIGFV